MTDLAVVEAPTVRLSSQDLDMIRRQVVVPAGKRPPSEAELTDFGRACMAQRLNPFDRHIYLAHIGGRWTYFVGVHGRLVIAFRTGLVAGMEGPFYCHRREGIERAHPPDWDELWDEPTPPHAAKFVVHRRGMDRSPVGIARWQDYGRNTPVWNEKPTVMLGYKAITRALNLVFPDVMPPDAGDTADVDETSGYVRADDLPTPEVSPAGRDELGELLVAAGFDGPQDQGRLRVFLTRTLRRTISGLDELDAGDVNVVCEALRKVLADVGDAEPEGDAS